MSTITFLLSKSAGGFSSSPESASVVAANTQLLFQLDEKSATAWRLTGYSSNDRLGQLGPASIAADGASMTITDSNSEPESINISVTAKHRETNEEQRIDPLVVNEPPQ